MKILQGDALTMLRTLPDESVQTTVTSPPYWGLRDYGTATWEGGTSDCDHLMPVGGEGKSTLNCDADSQRRSQVSQRTPYRDVCAKCDAVRTDKQLGLEPSPAEYVSRMVEVFREVRRVTRADGTCWLNIGDSYSNQGKSGGSGGGKNYTSVLGGYDRGKRETGLKQKDLVGIPWMLAFALRDDGWYLRAEIIWHKPNPMPESVVDRPTKGHEQVFLLAKSPRYFYDIDAIREPVKAESLRRYANGSRYDDPDVAAAVPYRAARPRGSGNKERKLPAERGADLDRGHQAGSVPWVPGPKGANARTVWTITPKPYGGAHFAVMPEMLAERCIRAGSRIGDVVLDPFAGAGTTLAVALRLGRDALGVELNPEYIALIEQRCAGIQLEAA